MRRHGFVIQMTASALLIALGIVIPMFSPVKILLEPMSFTLASHVAIFIAMFISPTAAVAVTLGTTLGFFLGGFPIVVVLRAASHLVFALSGALYLKKFPQTWEKPLRLQIFSLAIAVIHALCEVVVVSFFFFGGMYEGQDFARVVLLLVGLGTVAHSIIDFLISMFITKILGRQTTARRLFQVYGR